MEISGIMPGEQGKGSEPKIHRRKSIEDEVVR